MCAQYFSVFPGDDLRKPISLSNGDCLANSNPGESFDMYLWVLLLRLGLGKADGGDFVEGIDGVRDDIVVHLCFVSHRIIGGNLARHGSDTGRSVPVAQITKTIKTLRV